MHLLTNIHTFRTITLNNTLLTVVPIRNNPTNFDHSSQRVSKYLQEGKSISDVLAAISDPASYKDMVTVVLGGCGAEFDILLTIIENLDSLPRFSILCASVHLLLRLSIEL